VTARASDASGRSVRGVTFAWSITGDGVVVRGDGARPAICAGATARVGDTATLSLEARERDRVAHADAIVTIAATEEGSGDLGVPEPRLVNDGAGNWRSRMIGAEWQVNEAHEDYRALCADPRSRLRYFISLFAREIVLRNAPSAENARVLESLVEILAHAERNLSTAQRAPRG
jgi:hypothetical protein